MSVDYFGPGGLQKAREALADSFNQDMQVRTVTLTDDNRGGRVRSVTLGPSVPCRLTPSSPQEAQRTLSGERVTSRRYFRLAWGPWPVLMLQDEIVIRGVAFYVEDLRGGRGRVANYALVSCHEAESLEWVEADDENAEAALDLPEVEL